MHFHAVKGTVGTMLETLFKTTFFFKKNL
jgi:hypothetical protein